MPPLTMIAVVTLVVTVLITLLLGKSHALGPLVSASWLLGAAAIGSLWILLG
jgi:hypothetical protein